MTPTERAELVADMTAVLRTLTHTHEHIMSDDELAYVRLAIKKEAQSIKLREAVIEKTLAGLVWMCVLGFGTLLVSWLNQHGLRF